MVIMTVMAALAAPSMVVSFREARIRSATRQVLSLLHYARSRAVASRTVARVNVRVPEGGAETLTLWVSVQRESETDGELTFEEDTTPSGRLRELPGGILVEIAKPEAATETKEPLPFMTAAPEEEEGVTSLSFWRNGQTEDAIIQLTDNFEGRTPKKRYIRLEALLGAPSLLTAEELADDALAQELELGER